MKPLVPRNDLFLFVFLLLSYQFAYLTLQVLDTVELPLAAALSGDAVLASSADVVDELQLL